MDIAAIIRMPIFGNFGTVQPMRLLSSKPN